MKTKTYVLPSRWASALINDDYSGYTDEEAMEIEDFCNDLGPCLDVTDEEEFSWTNDANGLGGSVATFTFQVLSNVL